MSKTSTVAKKTIIRTYLVDRDLESIKTWAGTDRTPLRTLSSLLFEPDPLIAWRAIEALGIVSGIIANDDIEKVKRQNRRLLWLMNDESGGVCWNAPEALGEIVYNVPSLLEEFGALLPTYLEEEPFKKGSRWALARIVHINPEKLKHAIPGLLNSLDSDDPEIKAYSIMALKSFNEKSADSQIKSMISDKSAVVVYDYTIGELIEHSLSEIAQNYFIK